MISHSKCKYYFETECEEDIERYESLLKRMVSRKIYKLKPCCGISPAAIILDEKQPLCREYAEETL